MAGFQHPADPLATTRSASICVVMVRAGGRADASHASCAVVPGPPLALLAQGKSAGLRTRMRAFESPRGLQPTCLARRTQAALLKRPDQVRLLGGAPSRSRSFRSKDACVPCRRQGCKSPPRPQRKGMKDGWPRGLWRRFAESLRTPCSSAGSNPAPSSISKVTRAGSRGLSGRAPGANREVA